MKLTKRLALLVGMSIVAIFAAGCSGSVIQTTISTTTEADSHIAATTSTSSSPETTMPDSKWPVVGIKSPLEYVPDSAAKAEEEGWILLNDHLKWEEPVIQPGDWCPYYPTNDYTIRLKAPATVGFQLEIYAIEIVFANNQLDYLTQMDWKSTSSTLKEDRLAVKAPLFVSTLYKSSLPQRESTHDTEYYADADKTIPVNHFWIELDNPHGIPIYCEYELRCLAVPAVNELIEIRLWGKVVEAEK